MKPLPSKLPPDVCLDLLQACLEAKLLAAWLGRRFQLSLEAVSVSESLFLYLKRPVCSILYTVKKTHLGRNIVYEFFMNIYFGNLECI